MTRVENVKERKPSPLSRFMPDEMAKRDGAGAERTYVGEVVESSTTELIAEARELHGGPSFGEFIRIEADLPVLGIIFNVFTHSIEPNRRPTAYGKTEEELRLEQPQIFELLRTEFQALIIGYLDGGAPVQILPPQPARIHSFVHLCTDEEVRAFTGNDDYLRSILNTSKVPTDELLIAVLRHTLRAHEHSRDYLVRMGKELSRLMGDDYDRLSSVIRRVAN
jgi:hypothetical protein